MPYVRTKYEIVKCETVADVITKVTFKDNFVKAGDSIEELCDEVVRVVHYTKAKPFFVRPLPSTWEENGKSAYTEAMERCLEEQKEMKLRGDDFDLYGAIWTKGGLIYVAKMNEKGELELL